MSSCPSELWNLSSICPFGVFDTYLQQRTESSTTLLGSYRPCTYSETMPYKSLTRLIISLVTLIGESEAGQAEHMKP